MCLVYEKQVLSPHVVGKIPSQPGVRVKHIVVITDNPICPVGNIQAELERTHLILPGVLDHLLPGDPCLPVDDLIHRVIDPVKMALGIGTAIRVALRGVQKAQFILGGNGHCPQYHAPLLKKGKGLLRHLPGNGLGGQVKELLHMALSHGLQPRVYGGQSLSHPRRCLYKQIPPPGRGPVYRHSQFFLPFSVWVGKFQSL